METSMASYSTRQRLCGLGQLRPEQIVCGPHVQECAGQLEVAPVLGADELSITIKTDAVRSSKGSMEHVFLPTEQTTSSRLLASWHRGGVSAVLEELAAGRGAGALPGWVGRLAALLSSLLRLPYTASITVGGRLAPVGGRDRAGSAVRLLAWHPHTARLAVVLADDSARVYQPRRPNVPVIKHRLQRQVADLHWKPHSASLLAVACERCVLVWTVEPSSLITRPSGNCAQTLTAAGHAPVTAVAWSPLGDLLMSASPKDGALMLWSVAEESHAPLCRLWGLGNTFCCWSPDASRVFTATTGHTFRVWETVRWTDERWRTSASAGRVRAACWSPDGRLALFATAAEPVVYSLSFVPVLLHESTPKPVPVIDLAACRLFDRGEPIRAGGEISALTWDPSGRRLAVSFVDTDAVAVFSTELHPHLRVAACGLIRGQSGEYPVAIEFQKNLQETASLCIAWSSGRIQHVPLLVPRASVGLVPASLLPAAAASPALQQRSGGGSLLSPGASSLLSPGGLQLFSVSDSP